MNIFILEDDIIQQGRLEKIVKQLATKNNISYKQLYATAKPANLLKKIDVAANHRIYFLDIEIKNHAQEGLKVAQSIRKKDPYGTIVFVTTHSAFAPKTFAYKVAAIDFIEKDQDESTFKKRIEECLVIANEYKQRHENIDTFSFENKYTSFQVPFLDILYFETTEIPHKLKLVTTIKIIEFYGRLGEVVEYDKRLFRCHRSFVANLEKVKTIDRKNKLLFFSDDISCLISRRLLKEVENRVNNVNE